MTARVPTPLEEGSQGSLKPWAAALFLPLGLALAAAAGYHYYPQTQSWLESFSAQPQPLPFAGSATQAPQADQKPPASTHHKRAKNSASALSASDLSASTLSGSTQSASSSRDSVQNISVAALRSESSSSAYSSSSVESIPLPPESADADKAAKDKSGDNKNSAKTADIAADKTGEKNGSKTAAKNRAHSSTSASAVDLPARDSNGPWQGALLLMIKAARTGAWRAVENQATAIARVTQSAPEGNKAESREENKLGLSALKMHNFPKAIAAFEKGTQADPSDIEIANNYGYALYLAGRKSDAQEVLTHVLLRDPTREVAWTALVEARGEESTEALGALKIALHFAASRERTLNNFREMAQTHRDPHVRALVKTLLQQSDLVPTVPEGQH